MSNSKTRANTCPYYISTEPVKKDGTQVLRCKCAHFRCLPKYIIRLEQTMCLNPCGCTACAFYKKLQEADAETQKRPV